MVVLCKAESENQAAQHTESRYQNKLREIAFERASYYFTKNEKLINIV
jgi:hypothetical protein